jgi:hypothetical protein
VPRLIVPVSSFSLILAQIFPLVGTPADALKKAHFGLLFDGVFVSSRAAQFIQTPLADSVLRSSPQRSLVAVETCKYIPPLLRDKKSEFIAKEKEFAAERGWALLNEGPDPISSLDSQATAPVPRRQRDAGDTMADLLFFRKE